MSISCTRIKTSHRNVNKMDLGGRREENNLLVAYATTCNHAEEEKLPCSFLFFRQTPLLIGAEEARAIWTQGPLASRPEQPV